MDPIFIGTGLDRISDLPSNVIDEILSLLPFKDAVRTSSLSKNWKEKWHTVPRIIIDEELFPKYDRKLEGIITNILAKHEGRIDKFYVFAESKDPFNVKSWLLRLEQKGIQELFLLYWKGRSNRLPSILFSLQQLRKLSLRHCAVNPPHLFGGFPSLISLEFDKILIDIDAFEKIISNCPLLEQLTLRKLYPVDHLQINVPKLKYFCFDGEFISMCFNTPWLEVFSFDLYQNRRYYGEEDRFLDIRFKFCGLPSAIKELYVRCQFHKYLAACDRIIEDVTYSNLRTLQLCKFCFENVDQVRCLLSLIRTSPDLTTLDITVCRCKNKAVFEVVTKFWKEQNNDPSMLNQLKKVRVRSFHGNDPEIKLIQYIMTNSPELEEMTIEYTKNPKFDRDEVKGVLQLLCKNWTQLNFVVANHESKDKDDCNEKDHDNGDCSNDDDNDDDNDKDDDDDRQGQGRGQGRVLRGRGRGLWRRRR